MLFLNRFIVFITPLLLIGCASVERLAIPKAQLQDISLQQSGVEEAVNHAIWNAFLAAHTKLDHQGINRVSYANVSPSDHQALKIYIQNLSAIDSKTLSRNTQLAYWVNLYNAQTVDVVLDHYPVNSIREIKDGFFDLGPWEDKRLNIQGKALSLHDIEHGIIRPLWHDTPEVHYLLNCGAAGCPNLSLKAYQPETIEQAMIMAATAYVNNPRGVTMFDDDSVALSKIYSWYIDDFGGSEKAILDHLQLYAHDDLKEKLAKRPIVQQYFYDWTLNDTRFSNQTIKPTAVQQATYN